MFCGSIKFNEKMLTGFVADAKAFVYPATAQRDGGNLKSNIRSVVNRSCNGIPMDHGLQADSKTKMVLELLFQFLATRRMILPTATGNFERTKQRG